MKITTEITEDRKYWSVTFQGFLGEEDCIIRGEIETPKKGIDGLAVAFRDSQFLSTSYFLSRLKAQK